MKIIGVEYENSSPSALDNNCVAIDVTTDGEDRVRFVPLIRAKWTLEKDRSGRCCCSCCGGPAIIDQYELQLATRWCPWCGANME